MKQFTLTYRGQRLGVKFAVVDADSAIDAKRQILDRYPNTGITVLTCRENNPKLETVVEIQAEYDHLLATGEARMPK